MQRRNFIRILAGCLTGTTKAFAKLVQKPKITTTLSAAKVGDYTVIHVGGPVDPTQSFLYVCRQRFDVASKAERTNRLEALQDLHFYTGHQWRSN